MSRPPRRFSSRNAIRRSGPANCRSGHPGMVPSRFSLAAVIGCPPCSGTLSVYIAQLLADVRLCAGRKWVNRAGLIERRSLPFLPDKRTLSGHNGRSETCQERISEPLFPEWIEPPKEKTSDPCEPPVPKFKPRAGTYLAYAAIAFSICALTARPIDPLGFNLVAHRRVFARAGEHDCASSQDTARDGAQAAK